jgi:hypothetical protein
MSALLTANLPEFTTTDEAIEFCFAQGWTDGLPVIPPSTDGVERILGNAGVAPDEVVVDYEFHRTTVQMLAINAVMAGCLPEYFPFVTAAVRAVTAPEFQLSSIASAGSAFPLIIINGPQSRALGFNGRQYVFGPGNRPNATVGRALSLIIANCFDVRRSGSMGHAGAWAPCIAEIEDTQWEPLHMQRGFAAQQNVVTAFPSSSPPLPLGASMGFSAEQTAARIALRMRTATWNPSSYLVVISPALQLMFLRDGWSEEDLKAFLRGRPGAPAEILIVSAGGDAGIFGSVIPGSNLGAMPVSRLVELAPGGA